MHKTELTRFQEVLWHETLDNGLKVLLLPRPGFQQVFAGFTTRYGSVDRTFRTDPSEPILTVPDGIAHFLEHKMFESPSKPVFEQFAEHGASANAFTSFDQTTYLFSCTEDLHENLTVLLDFVQSPYFTEENVEKEKGIIGQEIRMYDDNPDARCFYGLLKALYVAHPIRIEIAGTVESIAEITKDTLYTCYNTFYHPGNMFLVISGGFDPEPVMELVRQNQSRKTFAPIPTIERPAFIEPSVIQQGRTEARLSVSQPKCLIGWKETRVGLSGRALLHDELLTGVVLDILFGRSSAFYHELLDEALVDQQFSWEYEATPSYAFSMVGGNTTDPDKLSERINAELQRVIAAGIDEALFERSRKKAIGRFMSGLDSPSYVARAYSAYEVKNVDFFESVDVLESITLADANERVASHFVDDRRAVSVVLPNGEGA